MTLVAAASPRTGISSVRDDEVLAEVDELIVRVLFDDIVRQLQTPVAIDDPEPRTRRAGTRARIDRHGGWAPPPRVHPGKARSPPRSNRPAVPAE